MNTEKHKHAHRKMKPKEHHVSVFKCFHSPLLVMARHHFKYSDVLLQLLYVRLNH